MAWSPAAFICESEGLVSEVDGDGDGVDVEEGADGAGVEVALGAAGAVLVVADDVGTGDVAA